MHTTHPEYVSWPEIEPGNLSVYQWRSTNWATPDKAKFIDGFKGYFLLLSCGSSLYMMDINPLSGVWFANIFSHSVVCLFTLWWCLSYNFLIFMKSNLFCYLCFGFISKKSSPNPMLWIFSLLLYSKNFITLAFRFRSLMFFELNFVYGVNYVSNFTILHVDILFTQQHVLRRLSFPH